MRFHGLGRVVGPGGAAFDEWRLCLMIFTLFDYLMANSSTKYAGRARQFSNQELLFGRGDPSGFLLKYRFETVRESQVCVFLRIR